MSNSAPQWTVLDQSHHTLASVINPSNIYQCQEEEEEKKKTGQDKQRQIAKLVTIRWRFVRKVTAQAVELKHQVKVSWVITFHSSFSIGKTFKISVNTLDLDLIFAWSSKTLRYQHLV